MWTLLKINVDGTSVLENYESDPTEKELYNTVLSYFEHGMAERIANELFSSGDSEVGDKSGTYFELHR